MNRNLKLVYPVQTIANDLTQGMQLRKTHTGSNYVKTYVINMNVKMLKSSIGYKLILLDI